MTDQFHLTSLVIGAIAGGILLAALYASRRHILWPFRWLRRLISGWADEMRRTFKAVQQIKRRASREGDRDQPWDYTSFADRRVRIDGDMLRLAREVAGLSTKQVGNAFGHTDSWIYMYESGRADPWWHDVRLLAEMLNVRQGDLLTGDTPVSNLDELPTPPSQKVWIDGARLRQLRNRRNWTQSQTAHRIDRNPNHYRRIEAQDAPASITIAERVCELFDVRLKDIAIPK